MFSHEKDTVIQKLLESSKYPELHSGDKMLMESILRVTADNAEALRESTNTTSDIAQFTPILMPLVRRTYPNLIANELLGMQPLSTPTGFVYALTNRYAGTGNTPLKPNNKGEIIVLDDVDETLKEGDDIEAGGLKAKVLYVEPHGKKGAGYTNVLVGIEDKAGVFQYLQVGETVTGGDGLKITATYTNEATFQRILTHYTGTYTTPAGEELAKDMKEIGFTIERTAVEAKTRKLKGTYTLEMYEDLKKQHGLLADEELINLMKTELQTEIDREVIDFVNGLALPVANAYNPKVADGRWEVEKYRTEAIKISNESREIGLSTRRGAANVILCSPKVVTMLEQIGGFKSMPYDINLSSDDAFRGVVGTFDGKKVICDQFAQDDYITLLYKGSNKQDAIGFFSAYIPADFIRVVNADSGQPGVILRSRYGLSEHPFGGASYARTFGVDFTGTALGYATVKAQAIDALSKHSKGTIGATVL